MFLENRPTETFSLLEQPLAIVGMACRLPHADGLEAYWELLVAGGYAVERMPDAKLDRARYFQSVKGQRGRTYSEIGAFVRERELDWSKLNLDPSQAGQWDECHLNFCEIAALACLDAGYDPRNLPNRNGGVFVGHSGGSTLGGELAYRTLVDDYVGLLDDVASCRDFTSAEFKRRLCHLLQEPRPKRLAGKPWVDAGFAAGIVSHCLGLTGPHLSIDAACASSLVALALGGLSLRSGQTEFAIVGGASFNKADSLILFSHAQSCSAVASRPFDQDADGLISSEGYVALVVKTLTRAIGDGDRIHALVRGIGMSTDGRGKSLWAPRKEGQLMAIQRAYSSEVTPDSVQMIEAHATSTHLGDATEMEALADFYGRHLPADRHVPVGSVKSNIGHTLEAAGMAGIVKSVLAIQNAQVPPSINVHQPSQSIPWAEIPLSIVNTCQAWLPLHEEQPRRAAVNAFGIGGLNVHVIVDQYLPGAQLSQPVKAMDSATFEPIAVIGRGLVLPGAADVVAFQQLLASGQCQLTAAPANASSHLQSGSTERSLAQVGYVKNFSYDWRKHKVPPKQVAQANPLQFMLLEAAEQALREAGLLEREFDRRHTAVIVGNAFGGDFGNALYAGLRLPEFRERLVQLLEEQGATAEQAHRVADDYETHFLEIYPALLDETGSFTSSTLASRLSKTFDLMGGAMAIDAGDTSSFAALNAACQLLHSGTVSLVLCAAAQHALDQAARENLRQLGRLAGSGSSGTGYGIGEGVALLLLKPMSAAVRDGDRVFATIDGIGTGYDAMSLERSIELAATRLSAKTISERQLIGAVGVPDVDGALEQGVRRVVGKDQDLTRFPYLQSAVCSPSIPLTGHLQAAQGLVDVIACSLNEQSKTQSQKLIAAHTLSGQSYLVAVSSEKSSVSQLSGATADCSSSKVGGEALTPAAILVNHFSASSLDQLKAQVSNAAEVSVQQFRASEPSSSEHGQWRAAIVGPAEQQAAKAQRLASLIGNVQAVGMASDQGLLWSVPSPKTFASQPPKMAWLFPGQGSQYGGMLSGLVASDPLAAEALAQANAVLATLGEPTFEQLAWGKDGKLGKDIWYTQAAMLVADWIMLCSLRGMLAARGACQPQIISGHSFGEIPAMLAAGCWDLPTALTATWHRCHALSVHVPAGLAMLSVQAEAGMVQAFIASSRLALSISHRNAPTQTVVGGQLEQLAQFVKILEHESIVCQLLPVPTAFHSPFLAAAVRPFRSALRHIDLAPPQLPLLSSVNNRFVADPDDLRDNLAAQLITPIDFISLVQRLVHSGVTHVVEVGPQQVLTRLVRQSGEKIVALPTDNPQVGAGYQLQVVETACELYGLLKLEPVMPKQDFVPISCDRKPTDVAIKHLDATQSRKFRLRAASAAGTRATETAFVSPHNSVMLQVDPAQTQPLEYRSSDTKVTHEIEQMSSGNISQPQNGLAVIEAFLTDFVIEQTGYPAEMIELDWELEADLGIDSIKKAQLFGELREFFDLQSHANLKLDEYRTLRQIAKLLECTPGKVDWLTANSNDKKSVQHMLQDSHRAAPCATERASAAWSVSNQPRVSTEAGSVVAELPSSQEVEQLTGFLIDFVVEHTGYPADIIELDADLEADLGIDSIKKAQLFGELREMCSLSDPIPSVQDNGRAGMPEFRTLRQLQQLLLDRKASKQDQKLFDRGMLQSDESFSLPASALSTADDQARPTYVPLSDSLPCWDRSLPPQSAEAFVELVHQNLGAMVKRRQFDAIAAPSTNGQSIRIETRVAELAERCRVYPGSLEALNRLLVSQVGNRPEAVQSLEDIRWCEAASCSQLETVSNPDGSRVRWLATIRFPAWLVDSGLPIGLMIPESPGAIELNVAGGVLPTILLHGVRCLIAGAFAPEQADLVPELSRELRSLDFTSREPIYGQCQRWQIPGDWWLLISEADRSNVQWVARREGVLETREISLEEFPSADQAGLADAEAKLGLDLDRSKFVVACKPCRGNYAGLGFDLPQPAKNNDSCVWPRSNSQLPPLPLISSKAAGGRVANRYLLRMAPAPQRTAPARQPVWTGSALVIGENAVARQLEARLRGAGVDVLRLAASEDPQELTKRFVQLTAERVIAHLFLLTPCDPQAGFTLDSSRWQARRNQGLMGNFWLCQRWLQHVAEHGVTDVASLFAVSTLGGDFGIGGSLYSAEGGALNGLLKSILIESWMQGYRSVPIKTLDTSPSQSPAEIVDCLWRELAIPSYDNEISYLSGIRHVVRAVAHPLSEVAAGAKTRVRRGGTWICTGGARGITAFVAERLALRYGLKLHLLGTADQPLSDSPRQPLSEDELRELKFSVMSTARSEGRSPIKVWQDTEKSLEISATLKRLTELGLEAHYHSCDVSDRAQLAEVMERVRALSGSVHGVLHGAGIGKDARFDRKQPEKVEQCIAAKVDGALALMAATWNDPLECFIGFGSISGRFGANGHTDYSLANEMLCKQIDWLRGARPEVTAVGFHWHAWGDIGMATKPETRLALEMIDMQFMPAEEGVAHLFAEIEGGAGESEVLITDERYYRMFYPAETIVAERAIQAHRETHSPLLSEKSVNDSGSQWRFSVSLNPAKDPFLTDHLLEGRPLLPFVVACEMLAEAGRSHLVSPRIFLKDIEACSGLRFFSDLPQQLIVTSRRCDENSVACDLFSDFIARDGRVVDTNRHNFSGIVAVDTDDRARGDQFTRVELPVGTAWNRVEYPAREAKFFVGWSLRRLRQVAQVAGALVGRISAPALIELAGGYRDVRGWGIPCAAMDACMFAVGILAWQQIASGFALPVRMRRLRLGRLPSPGEACEVHARIVSASPGSASFDFTLYGVDGALILDATGYEIAWLSTELTAVNAFTQSQSSTMPTEAANSSPQLFEERG